MKQKIPVFFNCLNNAFELREASPPKPKISSKFGLDDLPQTSKPKPSNKFRNTISSGSTGMDRQTLFQKLNVFVNIKKLANHMIKMILSWIMFVISFTVIIHRVNKGYPTL